MAILSTATRQLAERRARLAAKVPRLERLQAEVSERLQAARAELAAVDLILPTFDARVDPALIAPVDGRKGRYGKRGEFKDALLRMLKAAAPGALSTAELGLMLRQRFGLDFATAEAAKRWTGNVLRAQLRRLEKDGALHRVKVTDGHSDDAYWRVAPMVDAGSLDELRAHSEGVTAPLASAVRP